MHQPCIIKVNEVHFYKVICDLSRVILAYSKSAVTEAYHPTDFEKTTLISLPWISCSCGDVLPICVTTSVYVYLTFKYCISNVYILTNCLTFAPKEDSLSKRFVKGLNCMMSVGSTHIYYLSVSSIVHHCMRRLVTHDVLAANKKAFHTAAAASNICTPFHLSCVCVWHHKMVMWSHVFSAQYYV